MKKYYPTNTHIFLLIFAWVLLFGIATLSAQIGFSKVDLDFNGQGNVSAGVTSLMFGPDGRLYVAEYPGTIKILTINRVSSTDYEVTDVEILSGVIDIVNYDDDGTPCSGFPADCAKRETTGLTVAGTANNPVIYVTSSDFRIGSGSGGGKGDIDLDTNSGTITRLSWNGSSWDVVDLVRGLPRSEENHATNGLEFTTINGTEYLIVASGGNSNGGGPSTNFVYSCEYALSAAILSVDMDAINSMSIKTDANGRNYIYDLPTLDDPTRMNVNGISDPDHPMYDGIDIYDPFGGNDGLNQAIIVPGGPVQILSPGYRNSYDLVVTEKGALYITDNGANQNWGGLPFNEGSGSVTNQYDAAEPGNDDTNPTADGEYVNNEDHLELITNNLNSYTFGSFYGGHPNPIRANPGGAGLFTAPEQYGLNGAVWRSQIYDPDGSTPGSTTDPNQGLPANWPPVASANPIEGDWRGPGMNNPDGPNDNPITLWSTNTNGIDEYTASNFNGAMQGDLIAGHHSGWLHRVELNTNGSLNNLTSSFLTGIGGNALGVSCNSDTDNFPGTIWIGTLNGKIVVFEPDDYESSGTPFITQNLPDLLRPIDSADENIDLDLYFDDNNGVANLTYTVEINTNPAIVASINSNILTLSYPSSPAVSNITIRATDADSNYVEQSFTVTVFENSNGLLRINAGGPQLTHNGNVFTADQYFSGGQAYSNPSAQVPDLFKTERTSSSLNFDYNIALPNGTYTVILHFAEIYWGATGGGTGGAGSRVFDVSIENTLVLDNYDIIADVGSETPVAKSFEISLTDGQLNLHFSALPGVGGVDQPKISAIEINGDGGTNTAPTAVASATPTNGISPLEVNFTGSNSTDDVGVVSYLWDFKDGTSTSSLPNPVHTFTNPGTYHVELTVADGEGLTDSTTVTVVVDSPPNEAPVAVALGNPTSGTAPLTVNFNGSSSTDDVAIVSYTWDFDDGTSPSNLTNPVHTFNSAGTYQVSLTVEDAEGLSDSDSISITVGEAVNQPPMALATATPLSGTAPLEVSFTGDNSTDDEGVTGYTWDFGDGTAQSNEANPVHVFTSSGIYQVLLTVVDSEGLTDTDSVTIVVNTPVNLAPVAIATATPSNGTVPLVVSFTGTNSTDDVAIVSYFWDFDDSNATSMEPNPVHTFTSADTYQVVMTVTDGEGLTDSATLNILVSDPSSESGIQGTLIANPAKNVAQIQIIDHGPGDTKVASITLHDLNGRLVGLYSPKDVSSHGLYQIPISSLSDGGLYIIGFEMTNGKRISLKLVVKN